MLGRKINSCVFCGKSHEVLIDSVDWARYVAGALAQDAFPSPKYSEEDREFIISRICPRCQANIFA